MKKARRSGPQTADKALDFEGFVVCGSRYGHGILKPAQPTQFELKMVTLEQLVPKDYLLWLIDR